ncbi:hypothetical protein H6G54_22235 [Anabaena cylindrica FACHB-243]|uniref:RNA polymerase sigma factor, sigma-70 family n=1 Tax=Anabaena cylindrica (strain ATCC 27899 / PCC 7122) TaxID=272123 RepID=K9ZQC2_ANACC|nr:MULTISPECIES: hypothetical protein [Anabaena]AFZ61376.1 hypothetical protein Anacy_6105 [Anabaena cylindrica PCC 7122]MBD2420372.1 hypothetical protein [Anabaena cylindrica FACHB-243]MBY5281864.1 hypothetical protein [Anabaena sp. CCAP 1446/1C]MBY5306987.1 hypothetical protein [Anabaena sp. CCAP 1446/1C]MCM2406005.1 hypothetical protein [Anabaena sp. CCAP 1446/1C]
MDKSNSNLIYLFATFPKLMEHNFHSPISWQYIPRLKRNIEKLIADRPDISEIILLHYFIDDFRNNSNSSLSKEHLVAFASKNAIKTAYNFRRNINNLGKNSNNNPDSFQELIQLSLLAASNTEKIFTNFDSSKINTNYSCFSLRNYIQKRIEGIIDDELRKQDSMKTFKRSCCSLLRQVSRKQLIEALKRQNYREPLLSQYILIWEGFKSIYAPQQPGENRNLSSLSGEQYRDIINLYQKSKNLYPITDLETSSVDVNFVQQCLESICSAIRIFKEMPTSTILNSPSTSNENSPEMIDELTDETSIPVNVEAVFINEGQEQINTFLKQAIQNLDEDRQKRLFLRYALDMTDTEIGAEISKDQSSVGRRHKTILSELITKITQYLRKNDDDTPDIKRLEEIKNYLDEYLLQYYCMLIFSFFKDSKSSLQPQQINVLNLHYWQKINEQQLSDSLQKSPQEIEQFILNAQIDIETKMIDQIKETLKITLNSPAQDQLKTKIVSLLKIYVQ